jgi:hypothetical protein
MPQTHFEYNGGKREINILDDLNGKQNLACHIHTELQGLIKVRIKNCTHKNKAYNNITRYMYLL